MVDKVIVTNMSALKRKYGRRLPEIRKAIARLIARDRKRGLRTRLLAIDDRKTMKALNARPVIDTADQKANKRAIDAVYKKLTPDYLLILGATDVIPHQDLTNPVFDGDEDVDRYAHSDLPYACDAPFSRKPQDFIGPTRVVGRVPDLTGGDAPKYLVELLRTATAWKQFPRRAYEPYLAVSTQTWVGSSRTSLDGVFGSHRDLQLAPPKGPKWKATQLKRRAHFVNCHGALADFQFYGEDDEGDQSHIAHSAETIAGKIAKGTVAAIECCYGSELYDPAVQAGQIGICSTYLRDGAYGYVGATTISYGSETECEDADLICRAFLKHALDGASLGRAFLEARLELARSVPELDPFSLKTMAQFTLLGDPSIHPVAKAVVRRAAKRRRGGTAKKPRASNGVGDRVARKVRRRELAVQGAKIADTQPTAVKSPTKKVAATVKRTLETMARRRGLRQSRLQAYNIRRPPGAVRAERAADSTRTAPAPTGFAVLLGRRGAGGPVRAVTGIVARLADGRVISTREVQRR